MLAGGGALLWGLAIHPLLVRASRSWPSVRGTILSSDQAVETTHGEVDGSAGAIIFKACIAYEYVVDGQRYLCRKICVGGELNTSSAQRAQARLDRYPAGKQVRVFYFPGYPAFACLERTAEGTLLLVLGGLIFMVIGFSFWKSARGSRPASGRSRDAPRWR